MFHLQAPIPLAILTLVSDRCSPYSSQPCPYPDGFEGYGEVDWMAQNEGQKIESTALHFAKEQVDE